MEPRINVFLVNIVHKVQSPHPPPFPLQIQRRVKNGRRLFCRNHAAAPGGCANISFVKCNRNPIGISKL